MKTVLAFGEALWDLLPSGPALGGAPANFAYRLSAFGDRALLVTRLGRDEPGRRAAERLRELGLDLSLVQWDDRRPTGTVPVTIDARGIPEFTITPDVAYDAIEAAPELLAVASGADAVYFGTLAQRSAVSRETLWRVLAAAPRAVKFLDLNLRKDCFTPETIDASLSAADVLKLNESEAEFVARTFGLAAGGPPATAESILDRWPLRCCVVTLGERGAVAVSRQGRAEVPGWKVRVVDTVGSGDAFSAGFLGAYLRERPLEECLFRGNVLGALVAAQAGATEPIGPEDIRRFLEREGIRETGRNWT
ncbi:MAG: carbohydrate kinase family protein [Planctomycetota bacterium]